MTRKGVSDKRKPLVSYAARHNLFFTRFFSSFLTFVTQDIFQILFVSRTFHYTHHIPQMSNKPKAIQKAPKTEMIIKKASHRPRHLKW